MAIQNLPTADALASSDKMALFSAALGMDASATLATLLTWLRLQLTAAGALMTQYAAPNAAGFSVQVLAAGDGLGQSVWLLLTPLAGYAAGTIVLPAVALCQDQQELQVSTTQTVTALTVSGNGATVNGAPTTLTANSAFRIRFDAVLQSWYRI